MDNLNPGVKGYMISVFIYFMGHSSPYYGAVFIALIASVSRLSYGVNAASFSVWVRYFVMSLSITMLIVHIGHYHQLDKEFIIIISGVSAFMSKEILHTIILSKDLFIDWCKKRFLL